MNVLQNYLKNTGVHLMTHKVSSGDNKYHSHLFYEIFYITSQEILHEANRKKQMLSTCDICFLRPQDSHTFHRAKSNRSEHRDILCSVDLVKRACDYLDPSFFDILNNAADPFIFKLTQREFNELEREFTEFSSLQMSFTDVNLSFSENVLAVKLFNLLFVKLQNFTSTNYSQLVRSLISQLNDTDNFVKSTREILEDYNYNPSYISRVFSKEVGITISEYFVNAKLSFSVKLLQFTQEPITEVAIQSGFSTITYFNRVFKKCFGISPREYRNKNTPSSQKAQRSSRL